MTERHRLATLVQDLPEPEVHAAVRFLEYLHREALDPVSAALETAPFDDEPLSSEDLEALAEAESDLREGRVVSHDEARRRLLVAP